MLGAFNNYVCVLGGGGCLMMCVGVCVNDCVLGVSNNYVCVGGCNDCVCVWGGGVMTVCMGRWVV